ncbi:MAG: DUF4446 family protein [Clostridiales bacterium]|nr:DUF4446 family protein [Clostridiales bacterium]
MAVIVVLLFILVIVLFNSVNKVQKRYRRMMRGTNGKNLEELINSKLDKIDEAIEDSNVAIKENEKLKVKVNSCVQKVAIIRYKAFEDVGSDLSFSIAILDGNNDGIILTGIYGRQESTTYAKPVDKGISRYDLSEEEITALNEAINKN